MMLAITPQERSGSNTHSSTPSGGGQLPVEGEKSTVVIPEVVMEPAVCAAHADWEAGTETGSDREVGRKGGALVCKILGWVPRILVNIVLIGIMIFMLFLMWAPGYVSESDRSQRWMRRPNRPPQPSRTEIPQTNQIVQTPILTLHVR